MHECLERDEREDTRTGIPDRFFRIRGEARNAVTRIQYLFTLSAPAPAMYRGSSWCSPPPSLTPVRQRRLRYYALTQLCYARLCNTALLIYALYSVHKIVFSLTLSSKTVLHEFRQAYSWMPKSHHAPTVLFQTHIPKTGVPFDGKDDGRIFLAINGIVFNVTARHGF